jgi:hypothetical protein
MTFDLPNAKLFDFKQNEAKFLDTGVRCRLVASALVETGIGDAINLLFQVNEGQKAIDAKIKDPNNKIDIGGSYILTQQNFEKEGSVKFCLNLLRHTLGWNTDEIEDINLLPAQNGMTNEVMISTKMDASSGVSVVKVDRITKVDPTLTSERVSSLKSKWGNLISASKYEVFKFDKKAPASAPGSAPASGPPSRDTTGSPAGAAAEDDVPF